MNIKLGLLASAGLLATVGLTLGCGDSASTGGAGGTGATTGTTSTTSSKAATSSSSSKASSGATTTSSTTGTASSTSTGGGNDCAEYCATIAANCTGNNVQFADTAACMTACAPLAAGTPGATTGNTIACHIYHAQNSQGAGATTHCWHAGTPSYSDSTKTAAGPCS